MRMFYRCIAIAVVRLTTRMILLVAFVMLKRVVALVVIETTVRIHDDATCFV